MQSVVRSLIPFFFFFNDTATTEIYTLSLHDALPICQLSRFFSATPTCTSDARTPGNWLIGDRKSTRLNSSHQIISYAVFCLKKKKREGRTRLLPVDRLLSYGASEIRSQHRGCHPSPD